MNIFQIRCFLFFIYLFSWANSCQSASSTLNHQLLTVAGIEAPNELQVFRNSTGHIIKFEGVSWKILEWIAAAHINTTFDIIPFNPLMNPLDAYKDKPGVIELVGKGEYDMMTNSVPIPSRASLVDYTLPTSYIAVSYLIPSPYQSNNVFSAMKPFQTWVWVIILLTILVVFATLALMELLGKEHHQRYFGLEIIFYVLGVLLYQAATYRFRKRLAIRIVVAAWSLAALLLVNYYNSLYISFLTINVKHPLIQSIHELQAHPEIRLVTDKNRNTAALLLSAESGLLKGLGDKLRADPGSLCNVSSQCVDLVKKGRAVYTGGRDIFLMKVLKDDFKATGKCNMEMGKQNYLQLHFSWATQKKSPYLDPLNKSFLRLIEAGIFKKWLRDSGLPKVNECLSTTKIKSDQTAEGREPLPLKGFSGAFIILFVGILISLTVFFVETVIMGRIKIFKNNNKAITI